MAIEATEVRSFGFGHVYTGPVGAVEPATITDPVDTDVWTEHGHISDAGPRFSFGKGRSPQTSWQSFPDPVRNLKAAAATTVSFDLLQWNSGNLFVALGGGMFVPDGNGGFVYSPSDASDVYERALIVEATDGDIDYRFLFRRTENQANVDFGWTGTALAPLPIVSTVLAAPSEGQKPYIIQTNDSAIDAASA